MAGKQAGARARRILESYRPRNARLVDAWSFVHLATCAAMTLVAGPLVALFVATLWEPLEILVLSPLLARRGIDFGHESLQNSLSDVAFNAAGVALGWLFIVQTGWSPPLAP